MYKITARVPQGSPLSLYLFAIAMKEIAQSRIEETRNNRSMTLSYVEDFTILIGGKTSPERKKESEKKVEGTEGKSNTGRDELHR
jgi:hypothetical protein